MSGFRWVWLVAACAVPAACTLNPQTDTPSLNSDGKNGGRSSRQQDAGAFPGAGNSPGFGGAPGSGGFFAAAGGAATTPGSGGSAGNVGNAGTASAGRGNAAADAS